MISNVIKASNECSVQCNNSKYTGPREENPTEEACQVRENLSGHSTTAQEGCLSAEIQVVTGIDVLYN